MLRSLRFTLAALPAVLALAGLARADEIRYVDGRKPPGEVQIVSESYEEIVFKIGGSSQKEQASLISEVIHTNKSARYIAAESKFKKGDLKQSQAGRERGALEEFQQIIADKDKNKGADVQWMVHYALFYVAECHRLLGDNPAAIQAYQDVLANDAKSLFFPRVKIGIGAAKLAMNDKAGARQAFQELETEAKAKKLGTRWSAEASFALAEVLEADGSLKEALERFEKVKAELLSAGDRSSASVRAGINANRLRALIDPSKTSSAAQELERALQEQWKNLDKPAENEVIAAASNALGDVYMKTGDAKRALINYLRVATDEELKRLPGEGAKALWGAAQAFEAAKGDDWKTRADAMRRELVNRFPSSPWAKKKG